MPSFRKEKVATLIRKTVSEAVAHRMNDPRIDPLTSVTRVDMSADLQIARVYFVVPGSDVAGRKTLAALVHGASFLQRIVARAVQSRQCPELRFELDRGAIIAQRTMALLDENRRKDPGLFEPTVDEHAKDGGGEPQREDADNSTQINGQDRDV